MENLFSYVRTAARRSQTLLLFFMVGVAILSFSALRATSQSPDPDPTPTLAPTATPDEVAVRFAVIGDFGNASKPNEGRVATVINNWNPDFIITTGDNNYPDGEATTIDKNIGQFYSPYIGNYQGSYGPGSTANRFWPSLGNHDWHTISCSGANCGGAYFDYFTLPGNERYYESDLGLVRLFAIDSEKSEPDGIAKNSIQAMWLQNQLAASTSCYNIVYFHHAPYSSGRHGSRSAMRWPFSAWGADAIMSGHDHLYERLDVNGTPYFVNGTGGASLYTFDNLGNLPPEATSIVRYNADHGAMLVTATLTGITYQFYNADGVLIDDYTEAKNCSGLPTASPIPTENPDSPTSSPTPTDTAEPSPTPTTTPTISPSATPTPTVIPGGTLFFTPTDDASVFQNSPNNNYNSRTSLEVDGSPVKNFLIKFTVTGIGTQPVISAKLKLYNINASASGGNFYRVVDTSWNEGTVTWNTAPAVSGDIIAALGKVIKNNWYDVDVTPYITGDGTYSFRITSSSGNGADFMSSEGTASFIPQLEISL